MADDPIKVTVDRPRLLKNGETSRRLRARITPTQFNTQTTTATPDTPEWHETHAEFIQETQQKRWQHQQQNPTHIHTVGQLVNAIIANPPKTWGQARIEVVTSLNKNHIQPWPIAQRKYDDRNLRPLDFEQHINNIEPQAKGTREAVRELIRSAYAHATKLGIWRHPNPMVTVKVEGGTTVRKPHTPQQLKQIEDYIVNGDDQYFATVLALAVITLRPGEACGLQWGDVDLVKGEISVRRAVKAGSEEIGETKSWRGVRQITLPAITLDRLVRWRQESFDLAGGELPLWVLFRRKQGKGNFDFSAHGRPKVNTKWYRRTFPDLADAGVPMYSLRHWSVSVMRAAGVDPADAAGVAGHSVQQANDAYVHSMGGGDAAAAAWDQVLDYEPDQELDG